MFNTHREIRIVKTSSAIVPLVNVATRQRALRCLPLKQMESSSVDWNTICKLSISLTLQSRAKAFCFILFSYFLVASA